MAEWVVGVLGRGVIAADEPVVRADDLGLSRGDGCFETCRVVTDAAGQSRIEHLSAHLDRLARSLRALDLLADVDACRGLLAEVVAAWPTPGEAAIKLMVTRGVEGTGVPTVVASMRAISAESLRQRRAGVRVVTLPRGTTADAYAGAPWLLGGVKSLSYALNMAALREAVRRGAEDAIWLSVAGTVLEAPTATVVWAVGDRLLTTPTGASGILAGTTMQAVFDGAADLGYTVGHAVLPVSELVAADAIWLVSAVRGLAEVIELDGVARSARPAVTAELARRAGF